MSNLERKETIFVGDGAELVSLFSRLKRPERVQGVFCGNAAPMLQHVSRLGGVNDAPAFLEAHSQIRRVYCSTSCIEVEQVRALQQACKVRAVTFCAVLPVVNELDEHMVTMKVGRQLLLTPKPESLSRFYNIFLKRIFDFVVSLFLLLTVFPLVYLVKFFVIKRRKMGLALKAQRCYGPNGRVVRRLSFLCSDAEPHGLNAMPQLMNVFVGQMSLVGPAPFSLTDEEETSPQVKRLERRFVKPGITGWAKIHHHGEAEQRLQDDIWYVEHWSLWLDLQILIKSMFQ